jgi:hypothetical protein
MTSFPSGRERPVVPRPSSVSLEQKNVTQNRKAVSRVRHTLTSDPSAISAHLQRFICPIFGADARGKSRQVGSSVLFKVLSMPFLLTAAHVIDEQATTTLYVPGKGSLIELVGTAYSVAPPSTGRQNDHVDAGLILLEDNIAREVASRRSFLSPDDLYMSGGYTRDESYGFLGHPGSRNKSRPGNKVKLGIWMFRISSAPLEKYVKTGLDPDTHVLCNFERSKFVDDVGRNTIGPEPHGMSGGGVWTLYNPESESIGYHDPKLVAIATEWRKREQALVGARSFVFAAMIAEAYPETREFLPKSRHMDVQVDVIDKSVDPAR